MFFHFKLTPIAEIKPWGKKDELVLHWFGLSDGKYWIEIGETELFRYSKAVLAAQAAQNTTVARDSLQPYVDYFVVRLWEDILEIMPAILDPLPAPLAQRVASIDNWLLWCQRAQSWQEDQQELCSEETLNARNALYNQALEWWWDRQLYTGPIAFYPGIHFWNDGQSIHCLWDSRNTQLANGLFAWEAVYGTKAISVQTFIEAVTSFNNRFISAMTERVNIVQTFWSRTEIAVDLDRLVHDHDQRSQYFAKRMAEIPNRTKTTREWESILAAIAGIENDSGFLAMS